MGEPDRPQMEGRVFGRGLSLFGRSLFDVQKREFDQRRQNRLRFSSGFRDVEPDIGDRHPDGLQLLWKILAQMSAAAKEQGDDPYPGCALPNKAFHCSRQIGLEVIEKGQRDR